MNELKKVLLKLKNEFDTRQVAGDEPLPMTAFKAPLQAVSERNRVFLWINVSMLLVVFGLSIFLVYHFLDNAKALAAVFGGMGISLTGLISYMTYLWRQIVAIDLAIAMADRLQPEMILSIINSLLSRIDPPAKKKKKS
ncbi:hypothetical protein [Mucilaginibacter flavus]|uniref:hypothetical protein n=1 Tax=Mucilaginibacter flavus TaxID=931504 RepID=UPI0025B584DA|nr:hypothetical protein [Mucilaginibacter flavus]MDN3583962.1 hypothetical protein [Mucilaginibacter flavus]